MPNSLSFSGSAPKGHAVASPLYSITAASFVASYRIHPVPPLGPLNCVDVTSCARIPGSDSMCWDFQIAKCTRSTPRPPPRT